MEAEPGLVARWFLPFSMHNRLKTLQDGTTCLGHYEFEYEKT